MMKTFNEFEQLDDAGMRAEFVAVLTGVASGVAPSTGLRVLALRALRNQPTSGTPSKVVGTDEELATLHRMHEAATAVRH